MLGARNRISLNLIQYPSSDDLDDITSSSLSNLRYCTLVRMIYTGLNLATHRSASAMGADGITQSSAIPIQFQANQM